MPLKWTMWEGESATHTSVSQAILYPGAVCDLTQLPGHIAGHRGRGQELPLVLQSGSWTRRQEASSLLVTFSNQVHAVHC